jgi:hypothetical protein
MPCFCFEQYDRTFGELVAAWTAHYRAKGCTLTKARDVAWRRCQRKRTWPPRG